MDGIVQDLRLAARRITRAPGYAFVVVSVLALGIGANTALFSALNAALLSTPPYPDAERIVLVDLLLEQRAGEPADTMGWSYPKFEMGRAELDSFESLAGYVRSTVTLTGAGPASMLSVEYVTPGYFPILGVRAAAGRLLVAAEEAPADAPVALLSHPLWVERFGADPGVIGRTIVLNDAPLEVVGVVEEGFTGLTGSADVWVPVAGITAISGPRRLQLPWAHWLSAIGRLRPGVSLSQAEEDARVAGAAITEAYPDPSGGGRHGVAVVPYLEARVNPVARTAVAAVSASALLFLLIACGSVASLLLARASSRRTDVAVRAALGAPRSRLVREHLLESLILAGAGGTLGLGLALGGQRIVAAAVRYALDTSGTRGLQYLDPDAIRVGGGTLLAGLAVAVATGFVFGLFPAWAASRARPSADLRRAAGVGRTGPREDRGRSALVAVQLALTLVLLSGAGLMAASFVRLASVETGFAHTGVLTLAYERRPDATDEEHHAYVATLLQRIETLPGVASASVATCPPLAGRCEVVGLRQVDDEPPSDYGDMSAVLAYTATDRYFETIGAELLEGRVFGPADADAPPVVLVNQTAAAELFPGTSALGHRLSITHALTEDRMATVVGVVGDVRYESLEEPPIPAVYLSERQAAMPYGTLFVRTDVEPYELLEPIRREALALDPDVPLYDASTLQERERSAVARTRIVLVLLLSFALSGLLIGAIGLYGIVSHAVARRTPEVGLRIALGARPGSLLALLVSRPFALALGSAVVGVVASGAVTRYLERLLYGTSVFEPAVLAGSAVLLLVVATVAAWLPARRATTVDPVRALRAD